MSFDKIEDIALDIFQALDSASSLACAILLRHREYDQMAVRTTDPASFLTADSYRRAVAANDLLRKCVDLPTTIDKRLNACKRWEEGESQCFRTNQKFSDSSLALAGEEAHTFIEGVRKEVSSLLGRVPGSLPFRFGPGATFLRRGERSLLPDKISFSPEMTFPCWIFLREASCCSWFRSLNGSLFSNRHLSLDFPCVEGNRFLTVPKDGKTDRAIAVEPTFNVYLQLGIGSAMRAALNRHGLLLASSQDQHRKLAQASSVDGSLATIDLSNASDTVAYNVVKTLLPNSWFSLLDATRSPKTLKDGAWHYLEKFSSMGNGYTFELETLLFASLMLALAKKLGFSLLPGVNFSVYGDDIIVPSQMAEQALSMLRSFGFTPNGSKTFLTGCFRESCGGDYFRGFNVRACQFKDADLSTPLRIYSLHNMLCREHLKEYTEKARKKLIRLLPLRLRNIGCEPYLGDLGLHGVPPVYRWKHGCRQQMVLQPSTSLIPLGRWDDETAIASMLYGVPSEGLSCRGSVDGYRVAWVAAP